MSADPVSPVSRTTSWTPVVFSCLLIAVGQSGMGMFMPGLPAMKDGLGISTHEAQWLISAFLLGFGPSQLLYGPLSDLYGRRPVLLSGILVALAGVLLCLWGRDSATCLILGRGLQGVGSACASVIARVSLRDQYEGERLRQAMAYFGTSMAFFPTIAPLFGGYLTEHFGWFSLFITMAGFLSLIMLLMGRYFSECHAPAEQKVSAWHFIRQYRQLICNGHFCCYAGVTWIQYSLGVLCMSVLPFVMQRQLGISAELYGRWTLLPAVALIAGGMVASQCRRLNHDTLFGASALLQLVAGLCMSLLPTNEFAAMGSQAIFTFATGIAFPNVLSCLLDPFRRMAGTATALAGTGQMLVASLGTAWLVSSGLNTLPELGVVLQVGAVLIVLLLLHARHAVPVNDNWQQECRS